MFDFRLLAFGAGAIFPTTPEELATLRSTGTLREQLELHRPEPEPKITLFECSVTLTALPAVPCRVRRLGTRAMFGRMHADYRATPLPTRGDAVVKVIMAELLGTAVLPGDDLRSAATRARPPRVSGQAGR
ncbi:hypothetical protein [Frankia sp. AgPm24]|uniref:hypothetical protein n=1 Tax=Frankia sp. AgPm24 TaxID=631128 RepID=UPI00200E60CE|nr:hypothetical protein [Frankia sp. AgPm24]